MIWLLTQYDLTFDTLQFDMTHVNEKYVKDEMWIYFDIEIICLLNTVAEGTNVHHGPSDKTSNEN